MKKIKKESKVMETYTTEITYICPARGKVTEKVKVKRYKNSEKEYLKEVPELELEAPIEEE